MSKAQDIIMPERWKTALTEVHPIFRQDTLTIRFLGDVMMHSSQIANTRREGSEYDFSSFFSLIENDIRDADIAVANMEFTLAGEPYTGYPCFSAPDTLASYLADCGFDVFLAANNHIFDKGAKGAERTLEIYRRLSEDLGIRFTGLAGNEDELKLNNPLMLRAKGISIALLNFTYGTNIGTGSGWPATNYIGEKAKIAGAFSKAENGADCIIGAHPHVVQDCGLIDNVPVAYSLGNAVSNMSAANTQLELMATIRIVRRHNGDLEMLPLDTEYLWCSRPGGYNGSYTVIPIAGYIERQELWQNKSDYDKMIATYERVRKETAIE